MSFLSTARLHKEYRDRVEALRGILVQEARKYAQGNPLLALPLNNYDEVYTNLFLGDANTALNKNELKRLGITHVLNAAKGTKFSQVNTNEQFYKDVNIKFLGINLMDVDSCKIDKYLQAAADFINDSLSKNGKILVHCYQGISRSASFVLAYLMIYHKLTLEDALKLVTKKRLICPNNGFLMQLIDLDKQVQASLKHDGSSQQQ